MSRQFPLALTASPQVLPISGGELGFHKIFIGFGTTPASGFVSVEKRQIGSTSWEPINGGENVPIVAGQATVYTDGAINALRVSFIALDGGSAPTLWLSSEATAWAPLALMTDGGTGPNARFRVDPGQTGFFARREFRIVREFSSVAGADAPVIPTGQSVLLRSIVPINAILMSLRFVADQGHLRMTTWRGGAPTIGGVAATFPNAMQAIPANGMTESAAYSPQIVTAASNASATVVMTGSTRIDVERIKIATATGQATTAQASEDDQRGVNAESYYIWLQNIGAGDLEGVLKARYEERPNGSQLPFP